MTRMTRDQLASASRSQWRRWLRDGLLAFNRSEAPEARVKAFLPLVVRPRGHFPAGALKSEIDILLGNRTTVVAEEIGHVIANWSLIMDGVAGAIMGLELAAQLGTPHLTNHCLRLLAQPAPLSAAEADRLAWVTMRALVARASPAHMARLGQAFTEVRLWSPSLVAEYAALIGRNSLRGMPPRLLKAAPVLLQEPHTGQYASEIADRLALDFTPSQLLKALVPNPKDDEDTSRLRRTLLEELGFSDDAAPGAWVHDPAAEAALIALVERTAPEADNSLAETGQVFEANAQRLQAVKSKANEIRETIH